MEGDDTARLPLLYEKRLPHSTNPDLTAYCDVHDLIATVNPASGDVVIYRINGQIAFTIKGRPDEAEVAAMKWKPDGSLLGICWTDGMCGIYSGENGKLLSQTSVLPKRESEDWKLDLAPDFGPEDDEGEIPDNQKVTACIGWTTYDSHSKEEGREARVARLPERAYEVFKESASEEEIVDGVRTKNVLRDLITTITAQDVTKALPRLSEIPSHGVRHGPDGSKFASQAAVDDVFSVAEHRFLTVDSLITVTKAGHANILLDASVQIGGFELNSTALLHASHPECPSQAIVTDASGDGDFCLNYIDLPLDTLGGPLPHVIATNTKRLQNLMTYISQTVRCIQHDFTTNLSFPTRLMSNISEELREKEEGSLDMNLYQLAMTGSFTPTMLEWLTDIVKDVQHKRWDLAVSTMYSNIQDHLFINLLQALDRLSIAATTLRGHAKLDAKLDEDTWDFDVSPEVFDTIIDQADSLRPVAQKMLQIIMTESRQFRAFSKWLKVMIEVGIAGPGTKGAVETEEREIPNLDYGLLLQYIRQILSQSKLSLYLQPLPWMKGTCDETEFFEHRIISQMGRENTINALEQLDLLPPDADLKMKDIQDPQALINLPALAVSLAGHVRHAVESINDFQSKVLSAPFTTMLTGPLNIDIETQILDMRMFPRHNEDPNQTITCILASSSTRGGLLMYREIRLGPSKMSDYWESSIDSSGGKVLVAKLLTEDQAMVLYNDTDGRQLLVRCGMSGSHRGESDRWKVVHEFPSDGGFNATHFTIGGRKGKMVCVVFGRQGREWKVFDLDKEEGIQAAIGLAVLGVSSGEDMQL